MRIVRMDQRSPEWHVWRQRGLGSSDAAVVYFGRHFERDLMTLWREKTGMLKKRRRQNSAMKRGKENEAQILERYSKITGLSPEPLCGIHEQYDWLRASYDGWVEELGLAIEAKACNREVHQAALDEIVHETYVPQCIHQLLVAGAKKMHFVSWSDYFDPPEDIAIVRFAPSQALLDDLFAKEEKFWQLVESKTPP